MRVLGIDAGTRVGFGLIEPRRAPVSGSRAIAKDASHLGRLLTEYESFLTTLISQQRPHKIVVARLFIWRTDTENNVLPLFGLVAMTHAIAYECGVPIESVAESAARRAFLAPAKIPKGSEAIKAAIFNSCRARGWRACDHNASDALCIASYASAQARAV